VGYLFCLVEAEGMQGDIIDGTRKYHVALVVYMVFCCWEREKKYADVAALPGGGGMPLRWQTN
jgi:hypothetical protein